MKNKQLFFFAAMVFFVPAAAYVGVQWYNHRWQPLPVLTNPDMQAGKTLNTAVDLTLVNQDSLPVSIHEWRGKIRVLSFFFTHCPTICPQMIRHMKELRSEFAGDPSIYLCSISVDPEHDRPQQLKKYAGQFGLDLQNWDLLTGDKKDIYRFARNGLKVAATDGDGGPADFIHSDQFILVDAKQQVRGYYTGTSMTAVNQLIDDIKKLKHEME